jgi:two-component system phosphate regulon sensor histidine kinase PhoR
MTLLAQLAFLAAIAGVGWGVWESRRRREIERRLEREREALRNAEGLRLAEAEIRQQAVFNSMVEGLLVLDQQSRVLYVNPALGHLFLLPNPVRGLSLIEALRLHELEALTQRVLAEGRVTGFEVQLPGPPSRILQVNAATVRDPDQALIGTILVFHDLTRIQQLENVRKEFVANVSHELRTPITSIRGYAETLVDSFTLEPDAARFARTISRSAARLGAIIDDLLLLSSLEDPDARAELGTSPVRVAAFVAEAVEQAAPMAAEKRVAVDVAVDHDLWVMGNAGLLAHAVANLVTNAVKYGPAEAAVLVSARAEAGGAVVEVTDRGPGIPELHRARLFERFYRVDRARSRDSGGTGLGLAIVKHVAVAHGGSAEIDSRTGTDHGSTFRIRIPLAEMGPNHVIPLARGTDESATMRLPEGRQSA